ncbi:MAG: glycosyltransferase family 39 protein, partial [Nitrosospira sp.]
MLPNSRASVLQGPRAGTGFLYSLLESPFFLPGCFIFAMGVRAALIFFVPVQMGSDAGWFFSRGVGIANGEGYSEGGYPTAYWPVGYPGFLGILFFFFGEDQFVGQAANLLMAAATFFLQLWLTRRIFHSETTARLAVLFLAIYPNNIGYTAFLLTEVYFTFLLLLGTYLYLARYGWRGIFACGVVFGLATLTKPQVIFLPALLILFRLLAHEGWSNLREHVVKGITIYLIMAAVLTPWAMRNSQVFGERVLVSTNGGATLLTGNNPSADGGYVENDSLVFQRNFSVPDQVESDRRATKLAIGWIKENPGRFLELIPLKIWALWSKDGEAEWGYESGYSHYQQYRLIFRSIRWANQIFYGLLLVGALIAFIPIVKNRQKLDWPWVLFGYCFMLYLTA